MDEATEHKVRDLKLKLLMVEKELTASQHHSNLGAMLRAGNPSQMNRAAERDRKRLEAKRDDLLAQLTALDPAAAKVAAPLTSKAEPAAKASALKKAAAKSRPKKTA
jgi:hypothetical protein